MSGPDVASLPPDIQRQIEAYVQAELKRLSQPEPVKEPTPAEQFAALVKAAIAAENGDKSHVSGSGRTHEAIISALGIIGAAVFPPEKPEQQPEKADATPQAGN